MIKYINIILALILIVSLILFISSQLRGSMEMPTDNTNELQSGAGVAPHQGIDAPEPYGGQTPAVFNGGIAPQTTGNDLLAQSDRNSLSQSDSGGGPGRILKNDLDAMRKRAGESTPQSNDLTGAGATGPGSDASATEPGSDALNASINVATTGTGADVADDNAPTGEAVPVGDVAPAGETAAGLSVDNSVPAANGVAPKANSEAPAGDNAPMADFAPAGETAAGLSVDNAVPAANGAAPKANSEAPAGDNAPAVDVAPATEAVTSLSGEAAARTSGDNAASTVNSAAPSSIGFIDGHADSITRAILNGKGLFSNNLHVDFKRLSEFGAPVQVFAIWCDDTHIKNAYEFANSAIDFFESELAKHSDIIELALSLDDIERNAANNKISAILSLEGAEPLAGKIENIDHFYNRGVRLITLTWNRENDLGYGVGANSDKGLKPFGIQCVERMNELGIIIDVSHLNDAGFWDVDRLSARPYTASHSNAYSVTPNKRNLKDSQIKAIVEKGGVIGINLYPDFLSSGGKANVNSVISHIRRFIELGAGDFIGLGCDFDGFTTTPEGIKDVLSLKPLSQKISEVFDKNTSFRVLSGNYYDFLVRFFRGQG